METLELAAVLNRAADYLEDHGLRSGSWGSPGSAVCMNSAIAIALGREPRALGRMWFFNPVDNATITEVGEVILESGILDRLPVPQAEAGVPRRSRAAGMGPRRAIVELAEWSDAPGRTAAFAASTLRAQARDIPGVLKRRGVAAVRPLQMVTA